MALTKKNLTYIDGYNIINSWPELKSIQSQSLELAREKLIDMMAEYACLSNEIVELVFDAYNSDGDRENISEKLGIKIVYTKKFQTADTYIEKMTNLYARRHNVKVVTDDGQVQSLAFERGASRITALELRNELMNMKHKIKRSKRKDFSTNFKDFPISDELKDLLDDIGDRLKDE
ncbi:NYN domain-containing protein [Anaerococcus sp. AGMB00486]|uniref:NYN domain-containing protein n=2 Tax=Anaerococcus TaxID=165779 RepID=A0ABX2N8Y0_9FIRM|nr:MULTISPECIES: NYN domain-containing protein [Anaerococcus]MSS77470.1 NYN domain-containing protein [Anaerococcus porci]NVF11138.1 NYN domain-containing protein [Anaerococcus faecalis]